MRAVTTVVRNVDRHWDYIASAAISAAGVEKR